MLQALRKRHFQENEKFCSLKADFQGKVGLLRRGIREKEKKKKTRVPEDGGKVLTAQICCLCKSYSGCRGDSVELMLLILGLDE